MKNTTTFLALMMASLITLQVSAQTDKSSWLQFRGSDGSGYVDAKLPTKIDKENGIAWEAELPGKGPSSPIVVGENVIVTAGSGPEQEWMHVICFDVKTGKENWHRKFWATGRPHSHPLSGNAAPTPASDGKRIYAFFSSNDLICLDLKGKLLWYRGLSFDYPKAGNDTGMASSPIVFNGTVVVQVENQGDSFAAGIDALTGKSKWRVERNKKACWASPVAIPAKGDRPAMIGMQNGLGYVLVNAESGQEVWKSEERSNTVASSTFGGNRLYATSGGLTAYEFGSGAEPNVAWRSKNQGMGNASPIVAGDKVYTRNRQGVVTCLNTSDGKQVWRTRVGGGHWATPIVAGDYMYVPDQDGTISVLKLGDEPEVVSSEQIADVFLGSPAVAGNAMYLRSDKKLYKIADK